MVDKQPKQPFLERNSNFIVATVTWAVMLGTFAGYITNKDTKMETDIGWIKQNIVEIKLDIKQIQRGGMRRIVLNEKDQPIKN